MYNKQNIEILIIIYKPCIIKTIIIIVTFYGESFNFHLNLKRTIIITECYLPTIKNIRKIAECFQFVCFVYHKYLQSNN